jgi:ssDNA-binding Zn-finger/Zn-ribbon topoisomerase 1
MSNVVSLNVKCPICKESLMDIEQQLNGKPSIKLNIQGGGARGTIRLCSIYGCYDHKSEIDLSKVDIAEFSCPKCNQLLTGKDVCEKCGAPMISFLLDVGGRVNICSRKGCPNHFVAFENIDDSLRKFYEEYGD